MNMLAVPLIGELVTLPIGAPGADPQWEVVATEARDDGHHLTLVHVDDPDEVVLVLLLASGPSQAV